MNAKPLSESKPNWVDRKAHEDLARVREARENQVYPYFRPFETGGLHATLDGKPIVNFSSNDYLGLTNHPKVKEAAKKAVDKYACGLSSSRLQATTVEHVELEARLARFFGY
jgi:glycine C-acetyltransferase